MNGMLVQFVSPTKMLETKFYVRDSIVGCLRKDNGSQCPASGMALYNMTL